jgi:hypothetical protein
MAFCSASKCNLIFGPKAPIFSSITEAIIITLAPGQRTHSGKVVRRHPLSARRVCRGRQGRGRQRRI